MKSLTIGLNIIIIVFGLWLFSGCASLTREEVDTFTITEIDTTFTNFVKNSPSNGDNGVVFPSSREILVERNLTQRDSTFTRYYPDFIRLGFFEAIGTIGGDSDYGIGTGLFGIFPMSNLSNSYRGEKDKIFTGGIYRIGISETRLRWFRDAPNWTIGTNFLEFILPDSRGENMLIGLLPIYVRKRFYLREEIPYIAITPAMGFAIAPSQYINMSVSADIGSVGGLNFRAYLGMAAGFNSEEAPQIKNNDFTNTATSVVYPYAGLGISFLDFLNIVPETLVEWKDCQHSSWQLGLFEFGLYYSNAENSLFKDTVAGKALKGIDFEVAKTNLVLPFWNNRFYAGTSLFHFMGMGVNSWALSMLPLRFGYWHTLADDELTITPYLELGTYPSNYINLATELNLRISEHLNFGFKGGYISGSSDEFLGGEFVRRFGYTSTFSNFYFGFNFRFANKIFFEPDLRYNREDLPKQPKEYK